MQTDPDELVSMLRALDGVRQSPQYHPEGCALVHTLQVFDHARRGSDDPVLITAALLHDVGKAIAGPTHDEEGAALLDGLVHPRVVYLVAHHLDLLRAPAATRRRLRADARLRELELLRRFDLAGRVPHARGATLAEAERFLVSVADQIAPLAPGAESDALEA